jgi:hypothetical protein
MELIAVVAFDMAPDGYTIRAVSADEVFTVQSNELRAALLRDGLAVAVEPALKKGK